MVLFDKCFSSSGTLKMYGDWFEICHVICMSFGGVYKYHCMRVCVCECVCVCE